MIMGMTTLYSTWVLRTYFISHQAKPVCLRTAPRQWHKGRFHYHGCDIGYIKYKSPIILYIYLRHMATNCILSIWGLIWDHICTFRREMLNPYVILPVFNTSLTTNLRFTYTVAQRFPFCAPSNYINLE